MLLALLAGQAVAIDPAKLAAVRQLSAARRAKVEQIIQNGDRAELAPYRKCQHTPPRFTGPDWFTVNWNCPDTISVQSNGTAFKFSVNSDQVVRIEPANTPVIHVNEGAR
jgi:hypothetical protein